MGTGRSAWRWGEGKVKVPHSTGEKDETYMLIQLLVCKDERKVCLARLYLSRSSSTRRSFCPLSLLLFLPLANQERTATNSKARRALG